MYRHPWLSSLYARLTVCLTMGSTHLTGSHVYCIRPIPASKLAANEGGAQTALQSTLGRPLLPRPLSASSRFSHIMLDVPKAATRTLLKADAQLAPDPLARPRFMLDAPSATPASSEAPSGLLPDAPQAPSNPAASAAPATVPEPTIATSTEQLTLPPTYSPHPTVPLPPPTYTSSPSPSASPSTFPVSLNLH